MTNISTMFSKTFDQNNSAMWNAFLKIQTDLFIKDEINKLSSLHIGEGPF